MSKYKVGDVLYSCSVWDDDKYHIGIVNVKEARRITDAKGRDHGTSYLLVARNFIRSGKKEFSLKEGQIGGEYFRSAVEAVTAALGSLFSSYRKDSPEKRLLEVVFGKSDLRLSLELLPKVIRDLRAFEELVSEAFRLDANEGSGK